MAARVPGLGARSFTGVLGLLLVVAACSTSASATSSTAQATFPTTTTLPSTATTAAGPVEDEAPPEPPPEIESPVDIPGRLVLLDTQGAIRTSNGRRLAQINAAGTLASQPTWSPDGTRVAFTEIDPAGAVTVVLGAPDGSSEERYDAPFAPFYYYWSPDSQQLAFLGGNPIGLGLVNRTSGDADVVDSGQPYYFDWSPDSAQLVTNIGGTGVSIGEPGGTAQVIEPTPGAFQSPEWTPDGSAVIYVRAPDGADGGDDGISAHAGVGFGARAQVIVQQLVMHQPATSETSVLVEFSGRISFDISPDGSAVAFSVTPGPEPINFGPLIVQDLASRAQRPIGEMPVLAYEWSPDSSSLALLAPTEDQTALRWGVESGDALTWFEPFTPTGIYAGTYLPFFDQYARSVTMWSPDGSTVVYGAAAEAGDEIRLQPISGDAHTVLGPGSIAAFARG